MFRANTHPDALREGVLVVKIHNLKQHLAENGHDHEIAAELDKLKLTLTKLNKE